MKAWVAERHRTNLTSKTWTKASHGNRFTNAWIAEGRRWLMEADDEPQIHFKGATMDLVLRWRDQITFDDGDVYAYTKVRALPNP